MEQRQAPSSDHLTLAKGETMRDIHINGFFVQIMVKYNQDIKTELEALEEALRELKVEILREKARIESGR